MDMERYLVANDSSLEMTDASSGCSCEECLLYGDCDHIRPEHALPLQVNAPAQRKQEVEGGKQEARPRAFPRPIATEGFPSPDATEGSPDQATQKASPAQALTASPTHLPQKASPAYLTQKAC